MIIYSQTINVTGREHKVVCVKNQKRVSLENSFRKSSGNGLVCSRRQFD